MLRVYRRCCGMDVHKETVVVCVLPPDGEEGDIVRKVFGTFRNELARMRGWCKQLKITHIAMESTGVYWMPVWNVLDGHGFELMLVNPAQVKALQGRKSDQRDAKRIAEFLQDGRLDGSFVPPREIPSCGKCCGIGKVFWKRVTRSITRSGTYWRPPTSSCRAWRRI